MRRCRLELIVSLCCAATTAGPALASQQPAAQGPAAPQPATVPGHAVTDLTRLSLEQLAALRVTVVSKRPQRQWDTPAAVRVLTGDEILRSGARSIPEALRFAPGVQVARSTSSAYAIGVRGFASTLSRSLLVMIDGRSVYTPLFAGVYWDAQDVLLADVDRIEVVRGPGGTLWGANAVNGVVDLITKNARDTHGLYLEAGGGAGAERAFGGARYGGTIGSDLDYRVYAKYTDRAAQYHPDGSDYDAWHLAQGGFRLDRGTASDTDHFLLQGDLYSARVGQRKSVSLLEAPFVEVVDDTAPLSGENLRARWRRPLLGGSLSVQAYFDRYTRDEANLDETRDTFDLDLQHTLSLPARNQLVWGLGYRASADHTSGLPLPFFDPQARTLDWFTAFAQDEVALAGDHLRLTAGAKLEQNDYSGFDAQPSARLLWRIGPQHVAWAAFSRAVRTPSRADTDQVQTVYVQGAAPPVYVRAVGDEAFRSESADVYEAGYRTQAGEHVAFDLALFYDRHADLLGGRIGTPFVETEPAPTRVIVPDVFGNFLRGETHGGELAMDARPASWWRLWGAYSLLRIAVEPQGDVPRLTPDPSVGSSPRHQGYLRSSLDLPARTTFDASLRLVSALSTPKVPAYAELDLRASWKPASGLELALVGQNLLDSHHPEFGTGTEVRRAVYGQVSWRP